ncbi:hypothetical protein [Actinomadura sp. WMMB 499]|uniref:hypothetical protein n=1 Tax=Actinomadura sp. WMMB 499 TaxID=1219491 RepID=UPI0012472A07|nr:hypothetical protein [Actinomadura sp. WMMB 499]QFG24198.1 hypothetical protein F7P10_26810 [Actinomadura sp. WMMB 499]
MGVGLVLVGAATGAIGVGIVSAGSGTLGWETRVFTRIDCGAVQVKGGSVWHCTGEAPEQVRANDEAANRAPQAAPGARREDAPRTGPRQRTRLMFVEHDGRNDPQRVAASRVGDHWIAHSEPVVGVGTLLTIGGGVAVLWGGLRSRFADG